MFPDGSEIKREKESRKFRWMSDEKTLIRRICGDFRQTNAVTQQLRFRKRFEQ